MTHKFKVGDKVKVVKAGSGCSFDEKGIITTITKLREDYVTGDPGYDVKYLENFGMCIGESSFKLVEPVNTIEQLKKEIADKQRELSRLMKEESKPKYEVGDNVVLIDSYHFSGPNVQPGQCGKIVEIRDYGHYEINLGMESLGFPADCFKLVTE